MDTRTTGLIVVAIGVAVIVIGLLIGVGGLSWFGRLPGDIRYRNGNTRVYFPITTMIVVSVALSLVGCVARRLF